MQSPQTDWKKYQRLLTTFINVCYFKNKRVFKKFIVVFWRLTRLRIDRLINLLLNTSEQTAATPTTNAYEIMCTGRGLPGVHSVILPSSNLKQSTRRHVTQL